MATADEILAGLSTGDDTTLVIDNYLRTIAIPSRITNLGVESDDDVLTLNFKMPRYLDDIDLSKFSIRINYMNARGEGDAYSVNDNDKIVGTDSISFSWLVGPTATAYKGNTKFNVCMKTVNGEGYIEKEYNTTIATLPVLEGLEVDAQIVEMYSDILEQWKRELFGIGDTEEASMRAVSQKEQENIVQKGAEVLATIPEEYQETAEAAQEGIRTKADAIVCSAEGNAITVSNSSDDHIRGLQIFGKTTQVSTTGKNLLPNNIKSYGSRNGITFADIGNDRIRVGGTATSNTTYVYCPFDAGTRTPIPAGTYTLSGNPGKNVYLSFFLYESQESPEILNSNASLCEGKTWTFTISQDAYYGAYLFIGEGKSVSDTIISAQLEIGSVATDYEPYSGGFASPSPEHPQNLVNLCDDGTFGLNVYGKNLMDFVGIIGEDYTATLNGLTVTIKDGFAKTTGTNTSTGFTNILHAKTIPSDKKIILPAGTYTTHPRLRVSVAGKVTNAWANLCGTFYFAEPFTITGFYIAYGANETANESVPLMLVMGTCVPTVYEECRPYQSITVSTASNLPAIPVASGGNCKDANGQQWICDEIDLGRGVYVQRIGSEVFDGSTDENWLATDTAPVKYYISIPGKRSNYEFKPNALLCTHFKVDPSMNTYAKGYMTETYYHSGNINVLLNYDNGDGGVAGFKAFLQNNPITVQYVLETPVETPLTADELETFKALKTNYPNTTVLNDAGAYMELSYNADTKTYVDNEIKQTVTDVLEAIENGSY
jgi:hypothetical protein